LNHRQNLTVIRIKPNRIRNGMRSWIVRCIAHPHCVFASMAQSVGSGGQICEQNLTNIKRL
jgi:hypothetical protein